MVTAGCTKSPDDPPEVVPGLYLSNAQANESAGVMTFTVGIEPARSEAVSVSYRTLTATTPGPDIATANDDYQTVNSSVTIPAGKQTATFDITLTNDNLYERDEKFSVQLNDNNNIDIVRGTATGTIKNDDPKPVASVLLSSTTLTEGTDSEATLSISLDSGSSLDSEITVSTLAADDSSKEASNRIDFIILDAGVRLENNGKIVIPAANTATTKDLTFVLVDDGLDEGDEKLKVRLTAANSDVNIHATYGSSEISIVDNDSKAVDAPITLNDTGVINDIASIVANQDDDYGADAVGGVAAFQFVKLDPVGNPLADQNVTYDPGANGGEGNWTCVEDLTTGLVWEVKQNNDLLMRGNNRKIYWYDPDSTTNGTDVGEVGNFSCDEASVVNSLQCNTSYYAADMNINKFCGRTGWRLPTLEELRSIGNYDTKKAALPSGYFPLDTREATKGYWTSNTLAAGSGDYVWTMSFSGNIPTEIQTSKHNGVNTGRYVRLVTDQ